jgi:hypothetical protein
MADGDLSGSIAQKSPESGHFAHHGGAAIDRNFM